MLLEYHAASNFLMASRRASPSAALLPVALRKQGVMVQRTKQETRVAIPDDVVCSQPLVLRIASGEHRLHVAVGRHAAVHVVAIVPAGAAVTIAQEATVAAGGATHWHTLLLGQDVRHTCSSTLLGPRASASADVLCYAHAKERQKTQVHNKFRAADGGGTITITGVAEQQAHVQCNGMIDIGLEGRGTDTFLTEEVLMLDPSARVDAVPGLEIRTNDVKASHSATVSRLSSDDLFYFASRGIDERSARQMFVEGFLRHALQRIPGAALQQELAEMIVAKYRDVKKV